MTKFQETNNNQDPIPKLQTKNGFSLVIVSCDLVSWGMILGIDPGLANTGWAVIDSGKLIDYGCIVTDKNDKRCDRLGYIFDSLQKIIKQFKVKEVAFENLFFAKNIKSAMKVAEAIGMIKILGYIEKKEVFEYTPLQVKSTLVGYGKAEKFQVEMMVRNELGLDKIIRPSHAADAVAVALTHSCIIRYDS